MLGQNNKDRLVTLGYIIYVQIILEEEISSKLI